MRRRSDLFLMFAVVFAVTAAFVAVRIVRSFNETRWAVVAVREVPAYAVITADDVKAAEVPAVMVTKDTAGGLKEVLGRYTNSPILPGEIVRAGRLADVRPDRGLLSARLSELGRADLRAFAIPFDSGTGVGGDVRDGDRVDIVVSVKIDTGAGSVGVGKVVAANVSVLSVKRAAEGEGRGVLVLALTPSQIEDIAFALTSGQVRFALNPYRSDESASATPGVTGLGWLEKYGFAAPVVGGRPK